jgi:hypothetical protein
VGEVTMFVYDLGIVDFYQGMIPLMDYIKLCENANENGFSHYPTIKELKSFLIKCFIQVKLRSTYWEGDIRGLDEIAISAIPRPAPLLPYKILVFKQDNNGQSYMVSECEISTFDEFSPNACPLITSHVTCEAIAVVYFFEESYDLVEKLFNNFEKPAAQSINRAQTKIPTLAAIESPIRPLASNSLNLNDFERI